MWLWSSAAGWAVQLELPLAAGAVWAVANIPEDLTTFGPFSNRSGQRRARAAASSPRSTSSSVTCPGSATDRAPPRSNVRGRDFFFHNSYLATRQEGGWSLLLLVLRLLTMVFPQAVAATRASGDLAAAAAQAVSS